MGNVSKFKDTKAFRAWLLHLKLQKLKLIAYSNTDCCIR